MTRSDKVVRHHRHWGSFFRGIDSATNDPRDPEASIARGVGRWLKGFLYRGYATEDDRTPYEEDLYLCPLAWRTAHPLYAVVNLLLGLTVYLLVTIRHLNPWQHVRELVVHEAGHLNGFGSRFRPIRAKPSAEGGLPHEPARTLDLMLPGPWSWLRIRDRRGLEDAFDGWDGAGQVRVVEE